MNLLDNLEKTIQDMVQPGRGRRWPFIVAIRHYQHPLPSNESGNLLNPTIEEFHIYQGGGAGYQVRLRSKTSAERRKMTAFQGIFRSEGTRDGRGLQQHLIPRGAAARSHHTIYIMVL